MKKHKTTLEAVMQLQSLRAQNSIYHVSTPHGKKTISSGAIKYH